MLIHALRVLGQSLGVVTPLSRLLGDEMVIPDSCPAESKSSVATPITGIQFAVLASHLENTGHPSANPTITTIIECMHRRSAQKTNDDSLVCALRTQHIDEQLISIEAMEAHGELFDWRLCPTTDFRTIHRNLMSQLAHTAPSPLCTRDLSSWTSSYNVAPLVRHS
jgi:hypothetical protein